MYQKFIKRFLDFILSLLGIVILSPLLLIIALLIKLTSPGPVFFRQERTGKDNVPFRIFKFRTMRIDTPKDVPTHLLENPDQYITKIGKFLRRTSLDELPQLFNILCGDMAVVGPRPSLLNQYDLNALRDQNGASSVRPGLTGLAQISGRDELPIPVKARLDGEYARHITFKEDVRIFFGTIGSVANEEGIQEGKNE
ncbi:sugar transferase [Catenisphaera adipataccumulans]|jgi:O-antigen biosynthesis protein WbqP|uniref:O-antigen biosynthesis protein WbqP n=1 Tax=Catenisphaera adipataccumulans TaxID=700500 RepID=A0A7W8FUT7_9FIRM|nr:sugar transferase [Catenisphaera adipataccumulans]MBB5182904.1 O-antigen biosynthesis protein WbqP [Catenisphaera adipataccumulans]